MVPDFTLRKAPSCDFCLVFTPNHECYKTVNQQQALLLQRTPSEQLTFSLNGDALNIRFSDGVTEFTSRIPSPLEKDKLMSTLLFFMDKVNEYNDQMLQIRQQLTLANGSMSFPPHITATPKKGHNTTGHNDEMFDSPQPHRPDASSRRSVKPLPFGTETSSGDLHPFQLKTQDQQMNPQKLNEIISEIINDAASRENASLFGETFTNGDYPGNSKVVQNDLSLKDMNNRAQRSQYQSPEHFLTDIQLFVTNKEAYFAQHDKLQLKFVLRSANLLRAFVVARLEKALSQHGSKEVVLSEAVQRELHRLGAQYEIVPSREFTPGLTLKGEYQKHDLPVRIESFMRSFYALSKVGATFSNKELDLHKMKFIRDVRPFLNEGCQDLLPLFLCEETASAVITYQRDSNDDFPVYILDLGENQALEKQEGPIRISQFLKGTTTD